MGIAYPAALAWLALAAPLIGLYILKTRLRRVPVSTSMFWRQVLDEQRPRAWWQRLRHLLSLLVNLAFLLLLAFALAEPFLAQGEPPRRVVLVVDRSASMSATDGLTETRFERARRVARRLVAGLRPGEEMAILAAGPTPIVACGPTDHPRPLRAAVEALAPSQAPATLADAVALARRLAGAGGQVVVLSDAAPTIGFDDHDVDWRLVGAPTANVGITRLQARRSAVDPIGFEILAEVVNHGEEPANCRFVAELEGAVLDVIPLDLAPGQRWTKVIERTTAEGGVLSATLEGPDRRPLDDGLALDNRATALLPRRDPLPVRLGTAEPNLFLQKVFEANPAAALTVGKPDRPAAAGGVTVYHRVAPAKLPAGPVWLVDPRNDSDLVKVGEVVANPLVATQDRDDPLTRHVRLDNVTMPDARKLTFAAALGKPRVLVAALGGDPLFVRFDRPEGPLLVLTADLDKSDLPLRTAFPILAANALSWLSQGRGELRAAMAAGDVRPISLPPGAECQLQPPTGPSVNLAAGATQVGPLEELGLYRVTDQSGKEIDAWTCNLASATESDLRPAATVAGAEQPAGRRWSDGLVAWGLADRPLWIYLTLLAALLSVWEWHAHHRRVLA